MEPFKIVRASDQSAALQAALGSTKSKFIAGGTNLVDLMKLSIERPEQLVDINALDLNDIVVLANGDLHIGALVKNSDLAYHPTVVRHYPVLSEALLSGASAQLRNMASVGGNLMQRTRCYYFYDPSYACNKRSPGSGCAALKGYNRNHAVMGTSESCIATHPSDMCVALAALEARIIVRSKTAQRNILFKDFHVLPGSTPEKEHALKADELITAVVIPKLPFSAHSHYLKVRDRASYEFALCSAAVALDIKNGIIQDAKIAFGGIGTKPWKSVEAEKTLKGKAPSLQLYKDAADAALSGSKPSHYNAFKVELAKRTLIRALSTLNPAT
jgi:xanthine dehydrogenase YagS FAD-binding subunit